MNYLGEAFPSMDERDHYAKIFAAYENAQPNTVTVTLKEVALAKVFCDSYYLHRMVPAKLRAMKAADSGEAGAASALAQGGARSNGAESPIHT